MIFKTIHQLSRFVGHPVPASGTEISKQSYYLDFFLGPVSFSSEVKAPAVSYLNLYNGEGGGVNKL